MAVYSVNKAQREHFLFTLQAIQSDGRDSSSTCSRKKKLPRISTFAIKKRLYTRCLLLEIFPKIFVLFFFVTFGIIYLGARFLTCDSLVGIFRMYCATFLCSRLKFIDEETLCYGNVTCTLTQTTEQVLKTFERKILRRIQYMAQHKRKGAGALDGIINSTGYITI